MSPWVLLENNVVVDILLWKQAELNRIVRVTLYKAVKKLMSMKYRCMYSYIVQYTKYHPCTYLSLNPKYTSNHAKNSFYILYFLHFYAWAKSSC